MTYPVHYLVGIVEDAEARRVVEDLRGAGVGDGAALDRPAP